MIGDTRPEYLRLVLEPAERARMHYAVAVALWSIPQGTHIPALAPDFATQIVAYLEGLPRR